MHNPTSNRPERRTISRELKRFDIDIAALSETRLADEGPIKELGGGYTFFWKGKPKYERRIHGVGFAIKNKIVNQLSELLVGFNERLMALRLKLAKNRHATIISAYAPTLDHEDDVKEQFYAELDNIFTTIPNEDKVIILGDFNARVGRNSPLWKGIIGKDGVGKCNYNGTLLLIKCAEHQLVITNTLFRKFKTSWQHPRSKHWHLIDYVLVRARDRKYVHITKAMTSADDCWTDHRLICSKISITIAPKHRKQKKLTIRKINTEALKDPVKRNHLVECLNEKLSDLHGDIE